MTKTETTKTQPETSGNRDGTREHQTGKKTFSVYDGGRKEGNKGKYNFGCTSQKAISLRWVKIMSNMGSLQTAILSEREKAAVRLHIFGKVDDWRLLYTLAGGTEGSTPATTTNYVSKWKNSPKIQTEIEAQRREKFISDEALKERLRTEIRREDEARESEGHESRRRSRTDFTNPDEQKKLLNDLINDATDPDQKLDALKIIISGQRDDRQAAKEGRQVRAYLPQNCRDCVLFQREKARQEKKSK